VNEDAILGNGCDDVRVDEIVDQAETSGSLLRWRRVTPSA
jgi:hypothetical protein